MIWWPNRSQEFHLSYPKTVEPSLKIGTDENFWYFYCVCVHKILLRTNNEFIEILSDLAISRLWICNIWFRVGKHPSEPCMPARTPEVTCLAWCTDAWNHMLSVMHGRLKSHAWCDARTPEITCLAWCTDAWNHMLSVMHGRLKSHA